MEVDARAQRVGDRCFVDRLGEEVHGRQVVAAMLAEVFADDAADAVAQGGGADMAFVDDDAEAGEVGRVRQEVQAPEVAAHRLARREDAVKVGRSADKAGRGQGDGGVVGRGRIRPRRLRPT